MSSWERSPPDECSACGRPHKEHPFPDCGQGGGLDEEKDDDRTYPDLRMERCPPNLDGMARSANRKDVVMLSPAQAAWVVDELRRKRQRPECSLTCRPDDEEELCEAVVQYDPETGEVHSSGSRTALLVYIDRYLAAQEG